MFRTRTSYYWTSHFDTFCNPFIFCSGLIILNAWYGKFVMNPSQKPEQAKVIDVTVPLQCLVKDSKLILTEASKVRPPSASPPVELHPVDAIITLTVLFLSQAGLPGFYDPCVGEEKSLKLLYQFRGVIHQVLAGDTEALRIPKQCE